MLDRTRPNLPRPCTTGVGVLTCLPTSNLAKCRFSLVFHTSNPCVSCIHSDCRRISLVYCSGSGVMANRQCGLQRGISSNPLLNQFSPSTKIHPVGFRDCFSDALPSHTHLVSFVATGKQHTSLNFQRPCLHSHVRHL